MTKEDYASKYGIEVRYISELKAELPLLNGTMYVNRGINSDSKL